MLLRNPALAAALQNRWLSIGLAMVVCALAFYAIEHSFTISEYVELVESAEMAESAEVALDEMVAEGNLQRRLAFALLGAFGCAAWCLRGAGHVWRPTVGGLALLAYFGWCFSSILWADDPGMTLRRFGVLGFFFLAMLGMSKQFTSRELLWIVMGVTTAHLVWGVLVELRLGTFHPSDPEYRFAGTVHPNTQGIQCAALCLACFCVLRDIQRGRWRVWLLFLVAAIFLFLTRSRTSCAATGLALMLLWLPRAPRWIKATVLIGPPLAVSCALLAIFLMDLGAGDKIDDLLLMGRAEEAGTLTGRVPLWQELAPYARERLLTGYGYGGFWNPQRTRLISESQGWQIAHSHSAYYETMLNLGIVGLFLATFPGLIAGLRATLDHWKTGDPGIGFTSGIVVFASVYSVTDAGFALPGFMTLVMAVCMAQLLLFVRLPAVGDPLQVVAAGEAQRVREVTR